jgi:DNA-binding winged helix-turn-helix (wHTH) protein/TolB-like protein
MAPAPAARRLRFGPFEADLASGELWRDGAVVPLQDLPFRLLSALLLQSGDVVSRAELTTRLWGTETFVDATAGLNTAVAKLREALGDEAERPIYVETLPKRGYRFVAAVVPIEPAAQPGAQPAAQPGAQPGAEPGAEPAAPIAETATADARPQPRRRRWMAGLAAAAAVVAIAAAWGGYAWWTDDRPVRVAVVLFDNETGRPELTPLAQALTDATVASLTAEPRLAVIGNAAVLRTSRPFRDVAAIRDALGARFIIIGQVQSRDGGVLVRTHLIRGWDQAHLWIDAFPRGAASEADFQARVSTGVRRALMTYVP